MIETTAICRIIIILAPAENLKTRCAPVKTHRPTRGISAGYSPSDCIMSPFNKAMALLCIPQPIHCIWNHFTEGQVSICASSQRTKAEKAKSRLIIL